MTERVICKTQCKAPDGTIGTFLIDVNRDRLISPVCADYVALHAWCMANGWHQDHNTGQPYMREYVQRGVFSK